MRRSIGGQFKAAMESAVASLITETVVSPKRAQIH
jgi:hypothetical protein